MPKKGISKWNDEKIIDELKPICSKLNHFPTQDELLLMDRSDLISAITKNGGVNKFRILLNYKIIKNTKGFWSDKKICNDLKPIINKIGHFPIREELISIDRYDLICAIFKHGGSNKFRELLGCEFIIKPANYWTDDTTIENLIPIIDKLGHFPTQKELEKMDRNDLIGAINTHGGYPKFRLLLNYDLFCKPKGYWSSEKIVCNELLPICIKLNKFPTYHDLVKINRKDLIIAISKYGGFFKFRTILGYEWFRKPEKYWDDNTIVTDLKKVCDELGYFPSQYKLMSIRRCDLMHAIQKHGGAFKFQELCGYPISVYNEYISESRSYIGKRGKKSENLVKEITIKWCILNKFQEPKYNVKLTKGHVIEFVCNTGKTIGIDVTNTDRKSQVSRKWTHKSYHKYLDELWIVVFSNVFTPDDYQKWNSECPSNVKVFSIYGFLKELDYSLSEDMKNKIDKLNSCTFHTKEELKHKNNKNSIVIL